jgi:hypothetical protein
VINSSRTGLLRTKLLGPLSLEAVVAKLPLSATAEQVQRALERAKKVGAVSDEGGSWKLLNKSG